MGAPALSALAAALRRAGALLVEPAGAARAGTRPLDVTVAALSPRAGATTVSRGLAIALGRVRTVALAGPSGELTAGPGTALVREAGPVPEPPRSGAAVLVAVADGRREPALAVLVAEVLRRRHERVVLVANRARDAAAWHEHGALCVPESWLGAHLAARGRRPRGAMGAAFEAICAALE